MDPIRQRRAQPEQLTGKGETKRVNETYFEQLLQWLARCPALAGIALRVDDLPPARAPGRSSPKEWSRLTAGRTCWGR